MLSDVSVSSRGQVLASHLLACFAEAYLVCCHCSSVLGTSTSQCGRVEASRAATLCSGGLLSQASTATEHLARPGEKHLKSQQRSGHRSFPTALHPIGQQHFKCI